MPSRRFGSSRAAIRAVDPDARLFRRSFEDEVAIDFPSARAAVECLQRDIRETEVVPVVTAEIVIDRAQAAIGALVPLSLDVPHTCEQCGGRGEVWSETCAACLGEGHAIGPLWIDLRIPAGAHNGDTVRFVVSPRRGPRTRVHVRVAVG